MVIQNKLESLKKINELGLNKFPEQLFRRNEQNKVKNFLTSYPAKYYAIRDKSKLGGIFKLKIKSEDVIQEVQDYDLYTINVSSANYVENQVLVGEIQIFSNSEVYAILSTNPTASVRDALCKPTFNVKTDIFDKQLDNIPYFDVIYQYIVEHNLQNIIVEFAVFNIAVGTKGDNVVVYELRTNY